MNFTRLVILEDNQVTYCYVHIKLSLALDRWTCLIRKCLIRKCLILSCPQCLSLDIVPRLHTGQRPYCCQYCGKQFRHRSYFKVHLQAHQRSSKSKNKTASEPEKMSNVADTKTADPPVIVLAEPFEVTESGKIAMNR